MSTDLVRMKFAALAVKIEVTPGVDSIGGTPVLADWVGTECEIQFDPDIIDVPEYNGSLDKSPGVVGGLKPRLRLRMPLRGSGVAGTAPEWGKLMRACTFEETLTAAAVGAPTAAASGTTTTVTAATPFAATADLYVGMPLVVTGVAAGATGIMSYTAARVIGTGHTAATAYTTGSTLQIPINLRYGTTSDETVHRTVTCYFFADGIRWIFVGGMGTPTLELTSGGLGFLTFELRAQFVSKSITALPATGANGALTAANARTLVVPPRWVAGKSQLNLTLAQAKSLSIAGGVNIMLPDDPESAEGYGPALATERDISGSIDPYITTGSVALMTAFRAGSAMPLMAIIGSTAGNRFLVTVPRAKAIALDPTNRDGLAAHGLNFKAEGADSGFYLTQF